MSSVHWPGASPNGPPPTMSVIGANVPGGLNSSVVPSASPHARPSRAPRQRPLLLASLTKLVVYRMPLDPGSIHAHELRNRPDYGAVLVKERRLDLHLGC